MSLSRRQFLALAAGSVASASALAACAGSSRPAVIGAGDPRVTDRERRRTTTGAQLQRDLRLAATLWDLAGTVIDTWAFDGQVPGAVVRANVGDTLILNVRNELPEPTTLHWHGVAIRNDMDGFEGLSQEPIPSGGSFQYRFVVPDAGTYWFHPHMGLGLDRGLYAPLIVDDPRDAGKYDADEILILDDWLDGVDGRTPDTEWDRVKKGMGSMSDGGMSGMSGMGSGSTATGSMTMGGVGSSTLLGGDAGDVSYPYHLINGRPPADRATITVPTGKARLRIINAASDTAYCVAIGGHRLTVTHTDGFPVVPVPVDAILVAMGERYDVTVDVSSGAWPVVALAEGKDARAVAVLRTNDAAATTAPAVEATPAELDGTIASLASLRARSDVALRAGDVRSIDVRLSGSMMRYDWGINGKTFPDYQRLDVTEGERVRLFFHNASGMWHPMHLHGHTFQVDAANGGPRKDTVIVLPDQRVAVDVVADNPGQWALHCHNTYHLASGMATIFAYRS